MLRRRPSGELWHPPPGVYILSMLRVPQLSWRNIWFCHGRSGMPNLIPQIGTLATAAAEKGECAGRGSDGEQCDTDSSAVMAMAVFWGWSLNCSVNALWCVRRSAAEVQRLGSTSMRQW